MSELPQQPAMNPYQMDYGDGLNTESALNYQLGSDEIIEEVSHILKGEVLIEDEKTGQQKWITTEESTPLINEKGASRVLLILRSRISRIFILSDFDDRDIRTMTQNIAEDLIDELYLNWQEYDLGTTSSASMIVNLVTDTVYSTLRKAYMGRTLNYLKTTQRFESVQQFQQNPKEEKQGGGFLPFWRR